MELDPASKEIVNCFASIAGSNQLLDNKENHANAHYRLSSLPSYDIKLYQYRFVPYTYIHLTLKNKMERPAITSHSLINHRLKFWLEVRCAVRHDNRTHSTTAVA